MSIKEKNTENKCVMCSDVITHPDPFVFFFNDDVHFFCPKCAEPFKLGISLGQLEINSKFLSFISDLPDPVNKDELKKAMLQIAPMSKFNNTPPVENTEEEELAKINTPRDLYNVVSQTVVGQEEAKKSISVSVINHLQMKDEYISTTATNQTDKHHILMLGRSGSGKTLIANTVAQSLNLPFVMGDATSYSPTGFQGADVDTVIHDLLIASDMNFDLCEQGVVFIDEIDKLCGSGKTEGRYESFIGSTQSTFLKLIEGKNIKIPGESFGGSRGSFINIETSRMLFFFGGAFNGLADILAKKIGMSERSMGFRSLNNDKTSELEEALKNYEIFSMATKEQMVESLIEFGMLAELVGRIPTIVALKPLSKEELKKVLLESVASPISKQQSIFSKSGYDLIFTDKYIDKLVDVSYQSAVGTRALDSHVKHAVRNASFDLLSLNDSTKKGSVIIDEDCLTNPENYKTEKLSTLFFNTQTLQV